MVEQDGDAERCRRQSLPLFLPGPLEGPQNRDRDGSDVCRFAGEGGY